MKKLMFYILYLLVVWGGFRYFFDFSSSIEELWIKPVIWLVPLFWWNASLKARVLLFEGNLWKSVFMGIVVGFFYWLVTRGMEPFIGISLNILGVAFITAVVEELAFSGFILGYMRKFSDFSENKIIIILGAMVFLVRIPILVFDYRLGFIQMLFVSLFVFATSMINGLLRIKSKNVTGSIVARFVLNVASLI